MDINVLKQGGAYGVVMTSETEAIVYVPEEADTSAMPQESDGVTLAYKTAGSATEAMQMAQADAPENAEDEASEGDE